MAKKPDLGHKVVAQNRKARHNYFIEETFEAGLSLTGTEVKSLRGGKAQLKDGYAQVQNGEVWLHNVHIAPYEPATRDNHELEALRHLLHSANEIDPLLMLEPRATEALFLVATAPEFAALR